MDVPEDVGGCEEKLLGRTMDRKHVQQLEQVYAKFKGASKYNLDSEEVFCVCRKPDNGELMVACDGCDEWFHFKCMDINPKHRELVNNFYCKFCDILFNKGSSVWKKKCKLTTCFKPIQPQSQFCSELHGKQYWSEFLERFPLQGATLGVLGRSDIASVVQSFDNRDQLNELKGDLPKFDKGELQIPSAQKEMLEKNTSDIQKHKSLIEALQVKIQYMQKLKLVIGQINDYFTVALDPDNSEQTVGDNQDDESNKKKKKKRNSKAKKFKVDICGYNSGVVLESNEWLKYGQTNTFQKFEQFTTLTDSDKEIVNKRYEETINENPVQTMESVSVLHDLCLKEKRKCQLHNGWFNIIFNDLDLKVNEHNFDIEDRKKANESINQSIQIKNWEIYSGNV